MRIRPVAGLLVALVAAIPFAVRAQSAPAFHIPVILPLAGTAAFIGKDELEDLKLIEKIVNKEGGIRGRPVVFDVKDDGSSTQTAIQLANQILAAHPPMVLGTSLTQDCNAMMPLFENGPVDWCFSPAILPKPGGWVFSSSVSIRDCVAAQIRYFRERGLKRIAILSSTDATGQAFDAALKAAKALPENKDVEYVAYEHFNLTDVSVSAQVARMKAANPQAIFTWTVGPAFGTELHGLYDGGLADIPHAASNGDMVFKQLAQYKGFLPKELLFSAVLASGHEDLGNPQTRARQTVYFNAFKEAGEKPDFPNTLAWDPALLTIDMYRKLGFSPTPAQVKAWFDGLHGWVGINGPYDFRNGNRRGLGENGVIISRYDPQKDEFVTVSKAAGRLK